MVRLRSKTPSSRLGAALQALFVTCLWSTSWVLIKLGLADIPALTFAGLRYGLAFGCLLVVGLSPARLAALRRLLRRDWARLIALGVLFYALTQGAQFLGLALLPAATVSLLLNATPVVVALLGIGWLGERPTGRQWLGVGLTLAGVAVYFLPVALPAGQIAGLAVMAVGVLANAGAALLGRRVNRAGNLHPLTVTLVSMGVGVALLLATGLITQGLPTLGPTHWAMVLWLAVVNTAFAFTLWNHTLRTLSAMESSALNGTMLIQIALLAWLFLGEGLTWPGGLGLALVGGGALLAQLRRTVRR